jgi:hypothetical protein
MHAASAARYYAYILARHAEDNPTKQCPDCKRRVAQKIDKNGNPYWRCTDCEEFINPPAFNVFNKDTPTKQCPDCNCTVLQKIGKNNKPYWLCSCCKTYNNKPNFNTPFSKVCPECNGMVLSRFRRDGMPYWHCCKKFIGCTKITSRDMSSAYVTGMKAMQATFKLASACKCTRCSGRFPITKVHAWKPPRSSTIIFTCHACAVKCAQCDQRGDSNLMHKSTRGPNRWLCDDDCNDRELCEFTHTM